MPTHERIARISEEVRKELDKIIREELRDPRIDGTYSVTRADVTRDLRYCKVRVSVLEEEHRRPVMDALKNASGFVRRELGRRVNLRFTPEVIFELDTNIEYAAKINRILKETEARRNEDETNP